jgi:pilus assembly protein CpaE
MAVLSVKNRVKNDTARTELEKLIVSIPGFRIEADDETPCNLLIFELTNEKTETQFDFIRETISSGASRHIFLISGAVDPNLLIQALKVGAKEFFPLPLKIDEVKKALLKFQASEAAMVEKPRDSMGKEGTIIDVIGSKGGVGTTTIAVNLAADILHSDPGKMVALLDMNLLFGDIPIFLGMESPLFDWAEIARNISRLDSSFLMGAMYKHKSGLHVLPSPTSIFEVVTGGSEIIAKLLKLMKTMFDYIVIDGGQDLGEMSKAILKLADRVLIVTLLNLPCLINVKRLRETFLRLGYPSDNRVLLVANRVHKKSGSISADDAARTLKKNFSWSIPNDYPNTMNAINMGRVLNDIATSSDINRQLVEFAGFFKGYRSQEEKKKKRGLFVSLM